MFGSPPDAITFYYLFTVPSYAADKFSLAIYNTLWSYPLVKVANNQPIRINVGGAWLAEVSINLSVVSLT